MTFERTRILYGDAACEKIRGARVAVCGVGAVGSFAVEALARLGVENFELFDFDVFDISNINRQLCALNSTVGKPKVEVQKARILDINPAARVEAHNVFIDDTLAGQIAQSRPTVIVDAIDSIASKVALAKRALGADTAIVSSMGAARRRNPRMAEVADIFKTYGCPLASRIRSELRKAGIRRGYMCVFSPERVEAETHISGCGRKTIGSSVITTGVFGLNLADLALSEIIGK